MAKRKAAKKKYYVLRKGSKTAVFTGRSPRQAALKAAARGYKLILTMHLKPQHVASVTSSSGREEEGTKTEHTQFTSSMEMSRKLTRQQTDLHGFQQR